MNCVWFRRGTLSVAVFFLIVHLVFGLSFPPDESCRTVSVPALARPSYLGTAVDPITGALITRISDSAAFKAANVRHHYAKDQAWNCDQTLIKLNGGRILDGKTFQLLRTIAVPDEEKWSCKDPNKLFAISGNKFVAINATTGAMTTMHTFTGYTRIYMGPWEGNISTDDSTVVFVTAEGIGADILVYDIAQDKIVVTKSAASLGYTGSGVDWASVSQSGNFVVINGKGSSDNSVKSYDRNLNYIATLFAVGEHGDIGYDADGNEVFVQAGYPGQMARLSDGKKTVVSQCNDLFWGHFSCRNYKRPGWCYVTSNEPTQDVVAFKLDGSLKMERFTQHRSNFALYAAEPQGVVSPDGAFVMYASDWNGTAEINSFVVRMPQLPDGEEKKLSKKSAISLTALPNPAHGKIQIELIVPQISNVEVKIYNAQGVLVMKSSKRNGVAGRELFYWNSHLVPDGLYFVKAWVSGRTVVKKVVVSN